jgi:hypothetical protein
MDAVTVPMLVYVGDLDTVTPVEQAIRLKSAPAKVDLRIVPKAGHFSFMNMPPPGATDNDAFDRDRFLTDLAQTTLEFAIASLPAGRADSVRPSAGRPTYGIPRKRASGGQRGGQAKGTNTGEQKAVMIMHSCPPH